MRGTQVRGPEIPCRLNSCVRDRCETRRKEEGGRRGGGGDKAKRSNRLFEKANGRSRRKKHCL